MNRFTKLRHAFAAWLLAGAHLTNVSFGDHSITLSPGGTGDVISWSASGPAPGANQIGMNNSVIQVNAGGGLDTGAAGALSLGGTNATSATLGGSVSAVATLNIGPQNNGTLNIMASVAGFQGGTITIGNSAGSGATVSIVSNSASGFTLTGNSVFKDSSGNQWLGNVAAGGTANFVAITNGTSPVIAGAGAGAVVNLTLRSKSTGSVNLQPGADSTQAVLFQQAGGTGFFQADSTNSRIGIGNGLGAPSVILHVAGSGDQQIGGTGQSYIAFFNNTHGQTTSGAVLFAGGDNSGNSHIMCDFRMSAALGTVVGNIACTNAATTYNSGSDRRMKTDIVNSPKGLADVMRIRVRDFRFKHDDSGRVYTGYIAQELKEIVPDAVTSPADSMWSVDYGRVTPVLVNAIQELAMKVNRLEKQLASRV